MGTKGTKQAIRYRRTLFRLAIGFSLLWFIVVSGYASYHLVEKRAGCEIWMKLWGAEQRGWLRIDKPFAPVTRCSVSKHPINGFMVQSPLMPDLWQLGLALLPLGSCFGGRMAIRVVRQRWRKRRRGRYDDGANDAGELFYQDSIR